MSGGDDARLRARALWGRHPAGTTLVKEERGTPVFYAEMRRTRYRENPWLDELLEPLTGKRVLEIGCGAGTDLARVASRSRYSVGIDLALEGAQLALGSLENWDAPGVVVVADGQRLPFSESSFDLVYSIGVVHHTDDPEGLVREINRVLQPGGGRSLRSITSGASSCSTNSAGGF